MKVRRVLRATAVAALAALALIAPQAWAWGPQGHSTVGAIADQLLAGTPAEPRLRALLLPGETLAKVANWADCLKGPRVCNAELTPEMDAYVQANPLHREYHYTDVSIGSPGYRAGAPGTTGHDIVQILLQCVQVLRGNTGPDVNPHGFTPRQALLLIAHLVGDMQQPLHVGAVYLDDQGKPVEPRDEAQARATTNDGGNKLHIGGDNVRLLHGLWDFEVVTAAMAKAEATSPEDLAARLLRANPKPVAVTDPERDILAWTNDSLQTSRSVLRVLRYSPRRSYTARNGQPVQGWEVTLPPTYEATSSDLVLERLTLGGKRLAALLQAALPPAKETRQP
ncbi:MAG: S1/P1 nuclease [Ramlibacter sp.]